MFNLLATITLYGCVGYLGVVILMDDMSFWAEFTMLFTAPFVLIWQIIPSFFFELGLMLIDSISVFVRINPDAEILLWLGGLLKIILLAFMAAYYVITFMCFGMWLGGHFNNDPNNKPHTVQEIVEIRAREANGNPDAENLSLLAFGLTTNDEIILGDVNANAFAKALRR